MATTAGILNDLLGRIADAGRAIGALTEPGRPTLADLCEALLSGRGEATGLAIGREILDRYARLSPADKREVFAAALTRFGVDPDAVRAAFAAWRPDDPASARALNAASEPRTQELIRRLNRAPGGTAALVAMRDDLLGAIADMPRLAPLDADFRHLFAAWFNRGFLELRHIDWDTPAAILEKIIRYEAVHEIAGWDDLRRRVAAPDRRLYAFFHPALRDDPLIFVEVALTEDIPAAIAPILAEGRAAIDPARARTAVFYSISNCQSGLRGISFGNFLIKQVVEELRREFPALRTFVTLSPLPGLRGWALGPGAATLDAAGREAVAALEALPRDLPAKDYAAAAAPAAAVAARYLVEARAAKGGAVDPVARFHLGNGARLERVNPAADLGRRGRAQSWGVMVNYLYDLDLIERNHEAYAGGDEIIATQAVRRLARRRPPGKGGDPAPEPSQVHA
jgi:malonyl-CoA decarboxylase